MFRRWCNRQERAGIPGRRHGRQRSCLELKARGLDVDLEVYEDQDYYAAVAEIVVTDPGSEEIARVRVADNGGVTWERDYWPEAAVIAWESDYSGWIADPGSVAGAIVATITRAVSLVSPVSG